MTEDPVTDTKQEFQNDKIRLKVTQQPYCLVTLDIEIGPEETKNTFAKAVKAINKEVSLPGFRKGHAPDKLITQHYAKYVDEEWKRILSITALNHATELAQIKAFSETRVPAPTFHKLDKETGAELTFTLEREPVVTIPDPSHFSLESKQPRVITHKDEERELRSILFSQTTWEEITDRAVQENDYIDIDIDTLESPSVSLCRDSRFQVTQGMMPNWMRKLVIGLTPGQHSEGISERDEETMDEAILADFKPTPCRITVKTIFQTELPPIDDLLAKKVGAENVDDLKHKIRHRLENEARSEVEHNLLTQLIGQLLEKFPIDAPASLIEHEMLIKQANLMNAVLKDNDSPAELREKIKAVKATAQEAGEEWAKLTLFGTTYAKSHDLQITQGELYTEWLVQSKGFKPPLEMTIEANMTPELIQRSLYLTVVTIKALRHFLEEVQKSSTTTAEATELSTNK